MNSLSRTVGIDLGTTHSVLACVNPAGHSEILPDRDGNRLVPSLVLFEDDRILVGEGARLRARTAHQRLAWCVKNDMGRRWYSRELGGERLRPEVITAFILNKLREDVSARLGSDFGAVIAVPAFFDEQQRSATAAAAEMAGLNVLDVVNEACAAAIAYGEHRGFLSPCDDPAERLNVLVYDLGGSTFEATLLEISGEGVNTLLTDGDLSLGGRNWDQRLADCAAEAFLQRHRFDPRKEPTAQRELLARASAAKHTLTLRRAAPITLQHGGSPLTISVTREAFARATAVLVERTAQTATQLVESAGLQWKDVSRVLLVGGATRMPMVREKLRDISGHEPDSTGHPEEAVARGAAIYAHNLLSGVGAGHHAPQFRVANVAPHSLGIEAVDPLTGERRNKILVPRNTPLPVTANEEVFVRPSESDAKGRCRSIVILEGESEDPRQCTQIGRATIEDLPPEVTDEWPVRIKCAYGADGRIKLDARFPYTDCGVHIELVRSQHLSSQLRTRWREAIASGAGFKAVRPLLNEDEFSEQAPPIALAKSSTAGAASASVPAAEPSGPGASLPSAAPAPQTVAANPPRPVEPIYADAPLFAAADAPFAARPAAALATWNTSVAESQHVRRRRPAAKLALAKIGVHVLLSAAFLYFGLTYLVPAVQGYRTSLIPMPSAQVEGVRWTKEELVNYLTRRGLDFSAVYFKDAVGERPYVLLKFHRLGESKSEGAFINIHEHPAAENSLERVNNKSEEDGNGFAWGRFSLLGTDAAVREVRQQLE